MSALDDLRTSWRSYVPATLLYTPGNDAQKIAKLSRFSPQAVVLDLEDAVSDGEKVQARATARGGVEGLPSALLRCIRVNNASTGLCEGDVEAVTSADLDCVVYPKVEHPDELWDLDRWLTQAEQDRGVEPGRTLVIGLIETAKGLTDLDTLLARVPGRVLTVGFGLGDYSVDLGIELGDYQHQLDYPRARISVAARAHGLAPPIDGPWLRLEDQAGLHADNQRSRSHGFGGRQLIYPLHLSVTTADYLDLDDSKLAHFQRVVDGFEQAIDDGRAALQVDGQMVDYPIYHRALRALAAADRTNAASKSTPIS